MRMRKGYNPEYRINKQLLKQYPDCDIIRNPICDFMVINKGQIIQLVEVKSIHGKRKFYPKEREKRQLKRMHDFSVRHSCPTLLIIYRIEGNKYKLEKTNDIQKYISGK
jgi:penicillin-binding protein-related factor A (putative recombinase)